MKIQDAKREAVLQQWREMIYARCSSGHTMAGWCREHGVPVAPYCRRQKLVWKQESGKLSEKSIGLQMIQAEESQLTPMNFEAIPYCEASVGKACRGFTDYSAQRRVTHGNLKWSGHSAASSGC